MWLLLPSLAWAGLGDRLADPSTRDVATDELEGLRREASAMEDRAEDGRAWLEGQLAGAFEDLALPVFVEGQEAATTSACTFRVEDHGPATEAEDPPAFLVVRVRCEVELARDDAGFGLFCRPDPDPRSFGSATGLLGGRTSVSTRLELAAGRMRLAVDDVQDCLFGYDWAKEEGPAGAVETPMNGRGALEAFKDIGRGGR